MERTANHALLSGDQFFSEFVTIGVKVFPIRLRILTKFSFKSLFKLHAMIGIFLHLLHGLFLKHLLPYGVDRIVLPDLFGLDLVEHDVLSVTFSLLYSMPVLLDLGFFVVLLGA